MDIDHFKMPRAYSGTTNNKLKQDDIKSGRIIVSFLGMMSKKLDDAVYCNNVITNAIDRNSKDINFVVCA